MNVIGISGLPGSGKSLISKIAKDKKIKVMNMGDLVRKEAKKRNADVGETSIRLREEFGDYVLAKLTIDNINEMKNNNKKSLNTNNSRNVVIIEGIRSQYEVNMFRENFKEFFLLSVFSSPKTRFNRLKSRNRNDDSVKYEDFLKRDRRELDFGIGNVVATSDCVIINETDLESYKNQVNSFFNTILD